MSLRGSVKIEMKRLATYLPDPVYEEMERWANAEKRSLSNLAAFLLEQCARERIQQQQKGEKENEEARD